MSIKYVQFNSRLSLSLSLSLSQELVEYRYKMLMKISISTLSDQSQHPSIYNPFLAGHKIYNFGIQFLGYHYYILILSDPCSVLEKILKEIHQFYTFCPKITSPLGGGVMKFTISCLLIPYRCYIRHVQN